MCKILHRRNLYGIHTIINVSMKKKGKEGYLMKLDIGVLKPDHLVPSPLANTTNLPLVQIIIKTLPNGPSTARY